MFAEKARWSTLILFAILSTVCLFLIKGCGTEPDQPPQTSPGMAPSMIFVNDSLFIVCQWGTPGRARWLLDEFIFVGEVESVAMDRVMSNPENFQANDDIVGAKLFLHGDELIVVYDGDSRVYRLSR